MLLLTVSIFLISVCAGVYGRNKTWRGGGRHDRAGSSGRLRDVVVISLHAVQFYRTTAIFPIMVVFLPNDIDLVGYHGWERWLDISCISCSEIPG